MKTIAALSLILALGLGLFGCAGAPLPEGFDAEAVTSKAAEIVRLSTEGDYGAVTALLREGLKGAITAEQLEADWAPVYEKAGAFESVTRTALSGAADKASGEEYAVAQVLAKHANASLVYTLSFDRDLALVGLYLR